MTTEKCQRCGEEGHDRRTLWMACFYEMSEFNVPFEQVCIHGQPVEEIGRRSSPFVTDRMIPEWSEPDPKIKNENRIFYTLRVCKECRADWLQTIEAWFNSPRELMMVSEEVQVRRNIPVRVAGAVRMMTEEEYEVFRKDGAE